MYLCRKVFFKLGTITLMSFICFSTWAYPQEKQEITNTVGMKFKLIPAGSFMMGSNSTSAEQNEKPAHRVEITKPFYMGVHEVTRAQYRAIMEAQGYSGYDNLPAVNVSWDDAQEFCRRLSEKEGIKYRLPTEAEWEYACRAGSTTRYYWGNTMDIKYAWVHVSSGLQPVGQRPPNPFGLFDMIGNATEWCSDWLNSDYYNFSDEKDPQGPSTGEFKVYRGGSVGLQASAATCSYRTGWKPKGGSPDRGFRCVRVLETEANKEPESGAPSILDKELPEITNEFNIKLKLIPAGSFMMGSENGEADESPMHEVTITEPFYIGIYEITQEQYYAVMGKNPSQFRGANHPVNQVTREDAEEFCRKLNEHGYLNRDKYRLPTEAEWEYACRSGSTTDYYWGDEMDGSYAWSFHDGNESHPAGQKKPNSWGLYDLSGNVWEWCSDYYDEGYYNRSPQNDPRGPESGVLWVARGGSTFNEEKTLRSAERQKYSLGSLSVDIGFRIVKEYRESPASDAVIDEAALPDEVINSMGMKFKLIPSGSFMMGTAKPDSFEQRTHPMEITHPFYIGVYEVTQREFETVMGKNPSEWGGDNHPVHDVPWEDAVEFCQKLSEKEGVIYRLPTEAEWEYACRAGTTTEYYWGDKMDGNYAWYFKNSLAKKSRLERDKNGKNISVPIELGNSQEVGQKLPNAWGLYDMSGSVWEWCSDTYGRKYPNSPAQHVVRGGAFNRPAEESRSASRFGLSHVSEYITVGFRVVREVKAP